MELLAAIKGLEALKQSSSVILTTDSQYVCKGITQWILVWKAKSWKTAGRQDVKNKDLWERLDQLAQSHAIDWRWVKGHSGHIENERVDELANRGIDELGNL